MSVYKPKNSPYFHFDFQVRGVRFHGSSRCRNKRQAQGIEKAERDKAKARLKADRLALQLTIDAAAGRYWTEVGQHHACRSETWTNLERLITYFGKDKLLDEITDDDVGKAGGLEAQPPALGAKRSAADCSRHSEPLNDGGVAEAPLPRSANMEGSLRQ